MRVLLLPLLVLAIMLSPGAHADWGDWLKKITSGSGDEAAATDIASVTELSTTEIVAGLKEALDTATSVAVTELGQEGGFLDNAQVRISMPEQLQWVQKNLRKFGQEELADDFVTTMNRAAEHAVPGALEQFQSAISAMTLDDARGILDGPDDAATQYFRKHSEAALREQFLPLIQQTTQEAGVTSTYKAMTKQLDRFGGLINTRALDVDAYVTEKTLDGLFTMVALEEAHIRKDPVARTSDLLKKLFAE